MLITDFSPELQAALNSTDLYDYEVIKLAMHPGENKFSAYVLATLRRNGTVKELEEFAKVFQPIFRVELAGLLFVEPNGPFTITNEQAGH